MKQSTYNVIFHVLELDESISEQQVQLILNCCNDQTSGNNIHPSSLPKDHSENNNPVQSPYLTTEQASAYMSRSTSWMLRQKDISYFSGKPNMYLKKDLDDWLFKNRRHESMVA